MPAPINVLPRPPSPWIKPDGTPTDAFLRFIITLGVQNVIGPLTEAANDAAAKTAGVPLYGLYMTTAAGSSAVKIRTVP